MELISETPCIAVEDGELIDSHVIGWINHVLGTNYTVYDRYQNLWDKLMLTKNRQNLYSDIIKDINKFNAINTSIYRDIMAYLYPYQNDILQEAEKGLEKTEEASNIDDAQKTVQLSGLVNIVQNAITKYKTDHSYEDLIQFPFDEKENKRDDIEARRQSGMIFTEALDNPGILLRHDFDGDARKKHDQGQHDDKENEGVGHGKTLS